jgi:hypothetical protein
MIETWYVLADGRVADPNHVTPDAQGVLRHQDGVAVALGPHGPSSRSVEVDVERANAASYAEAERIAAELEAARLAEAQARDREAAAALETAEAERLKAQASADGARELQPAAGKPYRTRDLKAKD